MTTFDSEVRTGSVPAAARLILMGFPTLGVKHIGTRWIVRFSPAAAEALETFVRQKSAIDQLIEAEAGR